MDKKLNNKNFVWKIKKEKKAQSTIEYALLIAIVAAAFIAMQVYMQRAVQANFKLVEEQVNVGP
jgi:Flp pilus assembly pilin Flp